MRDARVRVGGTIFDDRERAHDLGEAQQALHAARVAVDVWESEEHLRAMMDDPEFQQNLRESGTPEPDSVDVWPVHASIP